MIRKIRIGTIRHDAAIKTLILGNSKKFDEKGKVKEDCKDYDFFTDFASDRLVKKYYETMKDLVKDRKYYINMYYENHENAWREVQGKPIQGFMFDFFYHKDNGYFVISEGTTGARIAREKRLKDAKTRVQELYDANFSFDANIDYTLGWIKDISPRYRK